VQTRHALRKVISVIFYRYQGEKFRFEALISAAELKKKITNENGATSLVVHFF
jgi:hypothetical protein